MVLFIIKILALHLIMIRETFCGRVIPFGSEFIVISSTNPNTVSDYYFSMVFETTLPPTGYVEIIFPQNQYPTGLTPADPIIYAPYPIVSPTATINQWNVIVPLPNWPAGKPIQIMIKEVQNPSKEGGTGQFQIQSLTTYDIVSVPMVPGTIIDQSKHFTVLGLSKPTFNLISATADFIEDANQKAGEISSYKFSMVPGTDLPYNIDFRISFPLLYDLRYIIASQCGSVQNDSGVMLEGGFYCLVKDTAPNVLIIKGNKKPIIKGTQINLGLFSVQNPQQSTITDLFKYEITLASTNSTLENSQNVLGLYIKPGIITNVQLSLYYPQYKKFQGFTRKFELTFKPTNPFVAARIVTDFEIITWCQITSGLLDTSLNSDSVCSCFANIITISNFQQYTRSEFANDYITVQFIGKFKPYPLTSTDVLSTLPVVISTFLDNSMLTLVDQDSNTIATQLPIDIALQPPTATSPVNTAVVFTLGPPATQSTQTQLQITFNQLYLTGGLGTNYLSTATFEIEIPEEFTGIPKCTYNTNSVTSKDYPCTFKDGLLTVNVSDKLNGIDVNVNPAYKQNLLIKNLVNPDYPGTYDIRANIYFVDSNKAINPFSTSFTTTITAPVLTGTPPLFYLLSVQPLTNTVLFLHFDFAFSLPSGVKTLIDPFSQYSYIDIGLQTGGAFFKTDLGLGVADMSVIDCISVAGLTNAPGYKIQCSIFSSLDPSYVIVRVQNYDQLQKSAGRVIKIGIPLEYVNSPVVAPKYYIKIYTSTNKIVKLFQQLPATNLVPSSGSVPAAGSTIAVTPATLNLQVQQSITIPLSLASSQAQANYNGIYMQLPTGYSFYQTPTITVDGTNYVYGVDYFFFERISTLLLLTKVSLGSGSRDIVINQFNTPDYYLNTFSTTLFVGTGGNYVQTTPVTFTKPTLSPISDLALNIDYPSPGLRWAKYSFEFTISMKSVNILEFQFDVAYSIPANDKLVELIGVTNLKDLDENNLITITVFSNRIEVSNFQIIDQTKLVQVTFTAITNPQPANSYPIIVSFRNSQGTVKDKAIQQSTVQATITGTTFTPEVINFAANSINSLPNNKNGNGIYIFQFKTTLLIPKGSLIQIEFPAEFNSFFQKQKTFISCQEQSSILYLQGCNYIDSTKLITMTTYADSNPLKDVVLEYYGLVLNQFDTFATDFKLTIFYKGTGVGVDEIFTTGTGVKPAIAPDVAALKSASLNYYPINEGERAYYEFTIEFNTITSLKKDQSFLVTFPLNYDDNLGPYQLIITSDQLQGALKYKAYKRTLVIYGFYSTPVTQAITLRIFGIVNPNRTSNQDFVSEKFGIGLIDSKLPKTLHGYQLLEASFTISNISPQLSPGGINFISVASTNQYARQQSNFTFVIEPLQDVLSTKSGGMLYFDFPQNFIIDSYDGTCNINQAFSFFSNCHMSDENLRFYFETINPQWTSSKDGYITAQVSFIRTPDLSGPTDNFIAYNYDSNNKVVLGRTYPNLFIASLSFSYQGRLITVNDDLPYDLEVGSFSDSITIQFNVPEVANYAAETTITLTPNVLDPSIIISPFPVVLQYKQTQVKFKIAAPRSILLKTFYITWSKTGDTFPPTYADLRKTRINMVQGSLMRKVLIENIPYIPQDGESYPLYVKVPNPPYTQLLVKICFDNLFTGKEDYDDYKALVNTTSVKFDMDTNQRAYTVFFRNNLTVASVNIYYMLDGFDKDSYELYIYDVDEINPDVAYDPLLGQSITKVPAFTVKPSFVQLKIQKALVDSVLKDMITRTSVTLFVEGDQKGFLYYVVANERIPIPTFLSVNQPSSNYTLSFSNPMYGANYIRKTNFQTQFTINDLTPGIDYEIYIYIMNMNLITNSDYQKIAFSTLQPQNIAAFTLRITQGSILPEVKLEYITKMANLVSIESSRIIERVTKCLSTNLDGANTASVMYWNLLLLPDPTNEDYLTTPINIASLLNDRKKDIQQFIPRLDLTSPFIMSNLTLNIPSFQVSPYMSNREIDSVSINYSTSQCGTLIVIAIPRVKSENSTIVNATSLLSKEPVGVIYPTSFEIAQGLNMTNLPVDTILAKSVYVDTINKVNNITFSSLNDRTVYDFYFSTINDFPMYNYYMDDNEVVKLTVKTKKNKIPLNIYSIQSGQLLQTCFAYILMLYFILIV